MNLMHVIDKLEFVKQTAHREWKALCPAHDDRDPSLCIKHVDGKLLVHCFAGCEIHEIVEALGLTVSDLFDNKSHFTVPQAKQHRINANARDSLLAISVPIRALMIGVEIQQTRRLNLDELGQFRSAYETVDRVLSIAASSGLVPLRRNNFEVAA
ncbi:MAG: hypothetical protein ACI89S_001145 [Gammaproteobacteria bacterium]|jgi:hypothetical protein